MKLGWSCNKDLLISPGPYSDQEWSVRGADVVFLSQDVIQVVTKGQNQEDVTWFGLRCQLQFTYIKAHTWLPSNFDKKTHGRLLRCSRPLKKRPPGRETPFIPPMPRGRRTFPITHEAGPWKEDIRPRFTDLNIQAHELHKWTWKWLAEIYGACAIL